MSGRDQVYGQLISKIVAGGPELAVEFLTKKGLLRETMTCLECNVIMKLSPHRSVDGFIWRCHNTKCTKIRTTRSIRSESPLEGFRADLKKIVHAFYLWAKDMPERKIVEMAGLSRSFVVQFMRDLRLACQSYFERNPIKLGGEGIICQADESCFSAKRKNGVGKTTKQIWVFGIVDTSTTPARPFMTVVPNRTAETLIPIIEKVCLPGTIIHTDGAKVYTKLSSQKFTHESVNHKTNFVDPITKAHTQNVESLWGASKARIVAMHGAYKAVLQEYLWEFMWRHEFAGNELNTILQHFGEGAELARLNGRLSNLN